MHPIKYSGHNDFLEEALCDGTGTCTCPEGLVYNETSSKCAGKSSFLKLTKDDLPHFCKLKCIIEFFAIYTTVFAIFHSYRIFRLK